MKFCCTVLAQTAIFGDIAWDSAKYNGYVADICDTLDHSRQVCKEHRAVQTLSAFPTNIYWAALGVRAQRKFTQLRSIMRCRFPTAAEGEGDYHHHGPSVNCFVASLAAPPWRASLPGWPRNLGRLRAREWRKRKARSVMQQLQMTARSRARSRDTARHDLIHMARWDCAQNRIT